MSLPAPLTPLVGRQAELDEVCARIGESRLLTLTGTGGTGKTRLALEAARRCAPAFRHGAVFVPLSEVTSEAGLEVALALALGVQDPAASPLAAVRRHLAPRQVLLVLDNFEQLVDAAAVVAQVLRDAPESAALVTSRFVLRVEGEQEWPVPPLGLAPPGATPEQLAAAPAVALFLARARAALPAFRPDAEELAYVAEICRRLDGLPLAIELAAARIKLFPPRALWERLAERFDLLSSPSRDRHHRHRTLEEALNWSHELLDADERVLLRRLAVFAGSFPLSAVEPVCGGPPPSLGDGTDLLGALVDRSLVERVVETASEAAAEARFRLLETTRSFALQRLREAGEEAALRQAHVRWVRALACAAEPELTGAGQKVWQRRLDTEHDNLLAALAFAAGDGAAVEDGLVAAAALARYWAIQGYSEGRGVLEALLAASPAAAIEPGLRANAMVSLGMLCHLLGDYPAAEERLHGAIAIFRHSGDPTRLAQALDHLGWIAAERTDLDRAEELSHEALDLHRQRGEDRGIAVAHNNLGWVRFFRGDLDGADEDFVQSIEYRRRAGDARGLAFQLINRALVRIGRSQALEAADLAAVDGWLAEAGEVIEALDDRPLQSWLLTVRAILWLRLDRAAESVVALRRALERGEDHENRDGLTWARMYLGEAEHRAGDRAAARADLEAVLATARDLGSRWIEMEALRRLADLDAESPDETSRSAARDRYRAALRLAEQCGVMRTAAACRRALDRLGEPGSDPAPRSRSRRG